METLRACYTKNPSFIPRKIADEHLLVPLRRLPDQPDAIYVMNHVGGFVWDQLSEATPVSTICERVVAAYEVTPDQATEDVVRLLSELASIGAIQPAP